MDTLDILWIVLAFSALWFTAFLCWAIYHIAMVARRIHLVLDEARHVLAKIETAISGVRDKMDSHAKIFDTVASMAGSAARSAKRKWDEKHNKNDA